MSEALAEALGGCVDPVPAMLSFEELFGFWSYSTNDGLSWSHLVEGSLDAATVVSRLRTVLDGGADPQRWESEDDSGLMVLDTEIGAVCCHLDDKYSLTLVSHVSGSEGMATEIHRCSDELGERVFAAARGETDAVSDTAMVALLETACCVGMAAAAGEDLDFVASGLVSMATLHDGSAIYEAVPVLLAQLSDGGWRAKPVGTPAVANFENEFGLDFGADRGWFDLFEFDYNEIAPIMQNLRFGRMGIDPDDFDDDDDDAFDVDAFVDDVDALDAVGGFGDDTPSGTGAAPGVLIGRDQIARDWPALTQARAGLRSICTDTVDGSVSAAETARRVESLVESVDAGRAWAVETLCDTLEEAGWRLGAPLVCAGADPHRRLAGVCSTLAGRMEMACLAEMTALAAVCLTQEASEGSPVPFGGPGGVVDVVAEAARCDTALLGADCARWRQAAEHLRRELRRTHNTKPGRRRPVSDRAQKLARKLLTRSAEVCEPGSSLVPEALATSPDPYDELDYELDYELDDADDTAKAGDGLDVLSLERGWQPGRSGTWTLGGDPRKPRLVAVGAGADRPPCVILLPPLEGPLVETWQIPSDWGQDMHEHGAESVTRVPVNDAYSTCARCGCPLIESDETQPCPLCGSKVATATLTTTAKSLESVSATFSDNTAAASAAVALSGRFRAWLLALAAQIG